MGPGADLEGLAGRRRGQASTLGEGAPVAGGSEQHDLHDNASVDRYVGTGCQGQCGCQGEGPRCSPGHSGDAGLTAARA